MQYLMLNLKYQHQHYTRYFVFGNLDHNNIDILHKTQETRNKLAFYVLFRR